MQHGCLLAYGQWFDKVISSGQSGLRVSAEGGGARGHAGVRRGGCAWKKIEGEEGGVRRPLKR
jgi:hypothetical protein